jgi:GTPase
MPKPKKTTDASAPTKVGYVALIGRPNTGKSTLLNKILGQKIAITSDKPQTTRVSILGIQTTDKGQIIFVDNPGIHKPLHKLNKRMMNFVYSSLQTCDLVCLLIDATEKFGHGDEFVLDTLREVKTPVFLLINKVDIVKKENILLLIDRYKDLYKFKEIIPISALRGTNLDVLQKLIYENLPAAQKLYGDEDITDQSERFLLAEVIREKVLGHVEKELPWATAVYIDSIDRHQDEERAGEEAPIRGQAADSASEAESDRRGDDREPSGSVRAPGYRKIYIKASIFVEKPNHRKIIIGRHGSLIKTIGTEARREIEDILEAKVYLDLQVKVRERWRDSADVLDLIEGQKEM